VGEGGGGFGRWEVSRRGECMEWRRKEARGGGEDAGRGGGGREKRVVGGGRLSRRRGGGREEGRGMRRRAGV